LAEAYLGSKVKVPTIEGFVQFKVPERTQSGATLRLRGKGVARKGKPVGDLYIHFQVRVPDSNEPEVHRLIEELSRFQKDDVRAEIAL
jgi:DnaJ-class molecular chaperone